MTICLTRFPISGFRRTQYIPQFGDVLQECGGFYLEGGLTCEELSGSYSQEMMGLVLGGYSFTFSPLTLIMSPSNVSNLGKWSLISNQGILSLKNTCLSGVNISGLSKVLIYR